MNTITHRKERSVLPFLSTNKYRYVIFSVNAVLLICAVTTMEWQRRSHESVAERMATYHLMTVTRAAAFKEDIHLIEDALVAHALETGSHEAMENNEPFLSANPDARASLYLAESELGKIVKTQEVYRGLEFEETVSRTKQQFFDFNVNFSGDLSQRSEALTAQRQLAGLALTLEQLIRLHRMKHTELAKALPIRDRWQFQSLIGLMASLFAISFWATRRVLESNDRAADALRESEARYRSVVEDQTELICRFRPQDGNITFVNEAYCRFFRKSHDELVGRTFMPLIPEEDHSSVQAYLHSLGRDNPVATHEHRVLMPDGEVRWTSWTNRAILDDVGNVVELQGTGRDITIRKKLEQEAHEHRDTLSHMARLNTMGEMATGIAHEINQPLAAIATYSFAAKAIVERFTPPSQELQEILDKTEGQAIRAGEVVRRLRNFIKKAESVREPANLNKIVQDVATFVEMDVRQAETMLTLEFDELSPCVLVDEIQIQQVLMNLIRNSLDAMQETPTKQRKVTVSTRIPQDGQAEVIVSDVGKGLTQGELEQVFRAFFSTKQEGIGMGLSISRTIVEAHGGKLWAKPNNGRGMMFGFTIPQADENPLAR